jgi:hypothetical protein
MTRRSALAAIAACIVAAACEHVDGAVEPVWGKQPCAHCSMVLSDRSFGAQLVTVGGERWFFDDAGCLVMFLEERHVEGARSWVRDAGGGGWIDVQTARFVAGAPSPMDYGFEARAGDGITWDAMRGQVLRKARLGS